MDFDEAGNAFVIYSVLYNISRIRIVVGRNIIITLHTVYISTTFQSCGLKNSAHLESVYTLMDNYYNVLRI